MAQDRKEYMRIYHQEYYKIPKNKEKRLKRVRNYSHKNKEAYRKWKTTLKCELCPETESCCLEFHHLDPTKKDFAIGHRGNKSIEVVLEEVKKCLVVCANCHKKIHYGVIILDEKFIKERINFASEALMVAQLASNQ